MVRKPLAAAADQRTAAPETADPLADAVNENPRDQLVSHLPSLRAFSMSLTRNRSAADDLVQDTIVKAWSNIDKFTVGTNLQAWLFTILRNTYYSSLRRTRREVADPDGIHAQGLFVRPDHDGRLAYSDFQRAFDQLSPEHREVLTLVGASGFSCEEAAVTMGVAVGTVKSRASRARKRLSELMGLAEGEDAFSGVDQASMAVMGRSGMQAA
jgi:RNA polymerase sigma-70 factor, ECF subfamily